MNYSPGKFFTHAQKLHDNGHKWAPNISQILDIIHCKGGYINCMCFENNVTLAHTLQMRNHTRGFPISSDNASFMVLPSCADVSE